MKTNLSAAAMSLGLLSLALCAGCDQQSAGAQEVPTKTEVQPAVIAAADEPKPADGKPAEPAATPPAAAVTDAKTPAAPTDTNLVQNPVSPDQLRLTPALEDVIKLVQAGVGEEVLMTYITNSVGIFNMGPGEILYLHDLGVPGPVITALIHQDSTPDAVARKQAANAVQPLPPGVALNKPATNIFTPRTTALPPAAPALETAEVTTDIPPVDTNTVPTVIYTVPPEVQQPVNVSYFYTELAPYGSWIDVSGYGRCWRPTVSVWNSSWRPYCHGGRWLWTDCGWYWYSDYTWGAHTFHYGRWTCPPGHGWVWVPGVHWGPAWVSWRHTRSHCAWAPLPPSARYVGGRGWYHNTLAVGADCEFGLGKNDYVALAKNQMLSRRPSNHFLSARHTETMVTESSVANNYATVNNTVVNRGVGFDVIAKTAGGNIRPISIQSADTVGQKNPRRELLDSEGKTLTIARPVAAAPLIKPPGRPMSSLSGQRTLSGRQTAAITGAQVATGTDTANELAPRGTPAAANGPTVIPSRTTPAPIIMRGSGRAAGAGSAAPVVAQPASTPPAATPDSVVNKSTANNAGAAPRAALPGGRRPSPEIAGRSRSAPSVAVAKPAPTTPVAGGVVAQPVRTPAARPEPARVVVAQPRVQPAPSPAPSQPRVAAPTPGPSVYRVAPSAPVAASVSPRMESYRASSPAPVARATAPAQSSGGSSRPSYSRDSGSVGRGLR
jgi:hypothetical protein